MKKIIFVASETMINLFTAGGGAEIKNFLTFDKLYKDCKIFKLQQNYRSTKNILDTASILISNNKSRIGKKLLSKKNDGELVKLNCYQTGRDEAEGVSDIIENNLQKKIFIKRYNNSSKGNLPNTRV